MATEPHTHPDQQTPPREREVIVTDSGSRSGGMSGAIVAVLAVIVIALIAWFAISVLGGSGDNGVDAPSVDVPSEVNINTDGG